MKAHRHTTSVLLALLVSMGAASAQTTVPASLKATPGSWNPAVQGFAVRPHQIAVPRAPGDANSIANVEKELNGGFGASIAAPGPNAGYHFTNVLDFSDALSSDGGQLFFNDFPFPGINLDLASPTYNPSNFVMEAITYLNLPAGTNYLGVRSDDSFRLSIGLSDNPLSYSALAPAGALFNGSRGAANNIFALNVTSAGVYPVRIVYGQGAGGASLEFWSTNDFFGTPIAMLINDPTYPDQALKSYVPASLPITPTNAYIRFLNPVPNDNNSQALPTITAELQDAGTTVVESSVKLSLDGDAVVPSVVKVGGVTTATFTPGSLLSSGAHSATVIFQDSASNWTTNTWSFSVPAFRFVAVPSSWSYPVSSRNTSEPGFKGLSKVVRAGANFSSTVANGDANLAGTLIDPVTSLPYTNLAANVTNTIGLDLLQPGINWFGYLLVQPDGTFIETNVVNYATDGVGAVPLANYGNTYVADMDTNYPGVPGQTDVDTGDYSSARGSAIELIGFMHLPAGLQVIGVYARDAFQLAFQANDARDIFRVSFTQNDVNTGGANYPVVVDVAQEGLYSFRLMQQRYLSDNPSGLELWTAPYTNQTQRTLVNAAGGVKVYRSVTVPTRPYIKSVTPAFGQTGVETNTLITATFANLGTNVPVLKVNGQAVSYTLSTNGSEVTLTHTPAAPFAKAELVTVEALYGNAASTWYFVTTAIYKALYVAGGSGTKGDKLNALRLASVHKMDVTIVSDANAAASGTNLATGKDLILFSSSALAGSNPVSDDGFHLLPIPIINWEQAYRDDLRMEDAGSGGGGVNNQTQVRIVGAGHPLAAGFPNGDVPVATATYAFQQTTAPAEAIGIATTLGSATQGILWGLTNGATCNPAAGPFTHPAKRVFIGWAGDSGSEWWNANGKALFDATIVWVLPPRPPEMSITASGGNVTISWTAEGVLQESATMAAGSWTDSADQTNPQTRPATGTKFFRVKQ